MSFTEKRQTKEERKSFLRKLLSKYITLYKKTKQK